jgi:hypothetical protein
MKLARVLKNTFYVRFLSGSVTLEVNSFYMISLVRWLPDRFIVAYKKERLKKL